MPIQPYDVLMAAIHGRRAIRRGDLAAAERWFKLTERAAAIAQRLTAVANDEARRQPFRSQGILLIDRSNKT